MRASVARRSRETRETRAAVRASLVSRVVICVSRAFCSTDQEKRETARSLGWRVMRKNMIGWSVVQTFSRLPISRTFKGNRKKVRVIESSKKIAGSKEKKTVFTAQWTFFIEMLSENWKIPLDYKAERNVTKHCLNRACVLLFWQAELFHNAPMGNSKFNVSDASTLCFPDFLTAQNMVRVIEGITI